jgi:hypothetical protein
MKSVVQRLIVGVLAGAATTLSIASAADVSAIDDNVHYGAASCAGSACHGKSSRQDNRNVWLNEHRIWRSQDYHSRAYKTLLSPESKLMAAKLGLASAHTADICLDCHADNVPKDKRGPEFSLNDGVACEACHGGSENWIKTHDDPGNTHADNIANGLYPSEQPAARAQLCLSCHLGTPEKFTTHRIMGAGHPRLSFELENFSTNQPPHFSVDDDSRERKGNIAGVQLWLTGQLEGSKQFLQMLGSRYFTEARVMPEFSMYDCQSCHHGLDPEDLRWYSERRQQGVEPGSIRLADHHFRTLQLISQELSPDKTAALAKAINRLVVAGQGDSTLLGSAVNDLQGQIDELGAQWRGQTVSNATVRALRKRLVSQAASRRMVDYGTAEQGLLSIVTLTEYLGESDGLASSMDRLFNGLGDDETFRPKAYQRAAAAVLGNF